MESRVQGQTTVTSGWVPRDGGGQRVSIGSTANRSTQLTEKETYVITAKVDCWIVAGGSGVDAVAGSDFFLPAYVMLEYTVRSDLDYISVIRDAVDSTNGLSICKVS